MSILKKLLLFFIAASGFVLIAAAFVEGEIKVQQSIDINAPVETVWNFTSNIKALNRWNIWFRKDKAMNTSVAGRQGNPGSQFCWESDRADLGKGCLTLSRLTTLRDVELDLLFYEPYKIHAKTYINLQPSGNFTRVTLSFNSQSPYSLKVIMLFKRAEKMIAANYARSLQELKRLSEAQ